MSRDAAYFCFQRYSNHNLPSVMTSVQLVVPFPPVRFVILYCAFGRDFEISDEQLFSVLFMFHILFEVHLIHKVQLFASQMMSLQLLLFFHARSCAVKSLSQRLVTSMSPGGFECTLSRSSFFKQKRYILLHSQLRYLLLQKQALRGNTANCKFG